MTLTRRWCGVTDYSRVPQERVRAAHDVILALNLDATFNAELAFVASYKHHDAFVLRYQLYAHEGVADIVMPTEVLATYA